MTQPQMALGLTAGELRTLMEKGQQLWLQTGRRQVENLFKAAGFPPGLAFSCNKGPIQRGEVQLRNCIKDPGLFWGALETRRGNLQKTGEKP